MSIEIHGKDYQTVAERLLSFRMEHPDYSINTDIVSFTDTELL